MLHKINRRDFFSKTCLIFSNFYLFSTVSFDGFRRDREEDRQTYDFLCEVKAENGQIFLEIEELLEKSGALAIKRINAVYENLGELVSYKILDLEDKKIWYYRFADYDAFKSWESEILNSSYFSPNFFTEKGQCVRYYGKDAQEAASRIIG